MASSWPACSPSSRRGGTGGGSYADRPDGTPRHPHRAGSRLVAADLPNATLHVEPHGDHITLFHAGPAITELALRFIAEAGI